MTPEQEHQMQSESARGAAAERLLGDPLLQEAFNQVEAAIVDQWKHAPLRDTEGQALIRMRLQAFMDTKKYIEDLVTTGQLASVELERERTLAQRAAAAVHAFRR